MRTVTTVVHVLATDDVSKKRRDKLAKQIETVVKDGIAAGKIKVGPGAGVKVRADSAPRLSLD